MKSTIYFLCLIAALTSCHDLPYDVVEEDINPSSVLTPEQMEDLSKEFGFTEIVITYLGGTNAIYSDKLSVHAI